MQRYEQDRVVLLEDLLRSVAVMHVEVDDRDASDAVRLQRACSDRDVVEDAETHRTFAEGVMARRPHEREPAAARRFDCGASCEEGRFGRRRARWGVEVEPRLLANCKNAVYMYSRVTPKHFFQLGRPSLVPVGEFLQQQRQPFRNLGVVTRRMQPRELRVREDVDR